MVELDGGQGEGGGQIVRTALALAMVTGRAFRLRNVRGKRGRPGLRPQHVAAVEVARRLCGAKVEGNRAGSSRLVFEPAAVDASSLMYDIGTAGSTGLVLHAVYLPLAIRAGAPTLVELVGGTFNDHAPSYPFLEATWCHYMRMLGIPIVLDMPSAGFYPAGGGRLRALVEPGEPRSIVLCDRGPLLSVRGHAYTCNLDRGDIAERMRDRAVERLSEHGIDARVEVVRGEGRGRGAALSLTASDQGAHGGRAFVSTYVGLGERGKRAEVVADEAVGALVEDWQEPGGVDRYSADQLLLPLALARGRSVYDASAVTEHLRTHARTIAAFVDREIRIDESRVPPRVTIE